MRISAGLCLILALAQGPVAGAQRGPFQAKVTGVTDGDTIEVLHEGAKLVIRLYGIDAPERKQAYAERAKRRVFELAFGRTVTVAPKGRDRYRRTLAWVVLPGGVRLNETLVAEGLAWWFRRYAPRERRLEEIEESARESRAGLWAEPDPTPPWLWRRSRKQ